MGSSGQSYTNLNFRTFRVYQIIYTRQKDEPLVSRRSVRAPLPGYPLRQPSQICHGRCQSLEDLDIGWRTARLNALGNAIPTCPYYEHLSVHSADTPGTGNDHVLQ